MKPTLRTIALVFAGGALGTALRYLLSELANWAIVERNFFQISSGWLASSEIGVFDPAAHLLDSLSGIIALTIVNSLGSACLGWFNGDQRFATENRRAFWSVGFAGGFTTMSGIFVWLTLTAQFSAEVTIFALAISVILSYFAYVLSLKIAKKWGG